ncbi:hypothetical protein T05_6087 [Trichinella murrelli]|uniref:Uncharacterized protein n=1 Tax=Trichinella murrelli TaxID=144512 RepID=A0A0V0TEI8_9BILA|nr:hypothetical protein T05_6087 [Trichinella murrelli]
MGSTILGTYWRGEGADSILTVRCEYGWEARPYNTTKVLWEEWTAGIQQSIGFGQREGGYIWLSIWCKDWRWGSQHCVGGMQPRIGAGGVRRWHAAFMKQWMQSQEGTSLRMSVGWTARPYTTRNALWNDCSAGLAMGFTSLGAYWRGVGGDSFLIVRWEYGRQCFNTELLLEGCGSGLPLLDGTPERITELKYCGRGGKRDRRWDSQHWVGSGGIGNGVQTMIRWWTYIEQGSQHWVGGIEIGNGVQTVIRRWKYIRQGVMKAVVRRYSIESVGWAARPYTTRNALWNDCSAGLAVGFTILGTYWREVGGDSILIVRWEYGRQCFNTEVRLDGCGSGLPLLVRVGWCSRKRHDCEHMKDGRPDRITQRKYCGRSGQRDWRWGSQHCVGGGWIGNGTQTVIRQWKYIEQVCNPEVVLEGCGERMPLLGSSGSTVSDQQAGDTSINALWEEWSARIQQLGGYGLGEGRGVGEDSNLIIRGKCFEQVYNTKLPLEVCGSGVYLLQSDGWPNMKRIHCDRFWLGGKIGDGGYSSLSNWCKDWRCGSQVSVCAKGDWAGIPH